MAQQTDMEIRGLTEKFQSLVMNVCPQIAEMCWRGLPVDETTRQELQVQQEVILNASKTLFQREVKQRLGLDDVNVQSPMQIKKIFKGLGFRLPIQKGKESTDAKALAKLRVKHPDEPIFNHLMEIRKSSKLLSSYLKFRYNKVNGRMGFSINAHGTETGRWACRKDAFDHGLNAQTIPKSMRVMFRAPKGKVLLQVDLAQAESRFIAWDGPVPKLMEFFKEGRDVHKYVASRIFNKLEEDITFEERQLGKKSGHAANYMVGASTFADACLHEMGLVFSLGQADKILEGYHFVFPEIRANYQRKVIEEVNQFRKLTTPMGRERYFYDRLGDQLQREACAYKPQSTIPDIINCLLKFMRGKADVVLQVHDSLLFEIPLYDVKHVIKEVRKLDEWRPEIMLSGGSLEIPIDIEVGEVWGAMDGVVV